MTEPTCSFCGKSREKAFVLIAGPACYICDECVDLCSDIVAENREQAGRPWVVRVREKLADMYRTLGEPKVDAELRMLLAELRMLLAEPEADERVRGAVEAACRIVAELREIRQAVDAAARGGEKSG